MSKTPDCFKYIDNDCIDKLTNLCGLRSSKISNSNIGSKNITKNDSTISLPNIPLPPPLPLKNNNSSKKSEKDSKMKINKQNENNKINDQEEKENEEICQQKKTQEICKKNIENNKNFAVGCSKENNELNNYNLYNLRYKLPLQSKLEQIGEAVLNNHLHNVRNKPKYLQLPEWFIGMIAGTITTTFFNIIYFKIFG